MVFAQWSGRKVDVYTETKQILRHFSVGHNVVGVQCSGDGNDATIAITMDNGKTELYRGTGQLIRR